MRAVSGLAARGLSVLLWLVSGCGGENPREREAVRGPAVSQMTCDARAFISPAGRWRVRFAYTRTRPGGAEAGSETTLDATLQAEPHGADVRVVVREVASWRSRAGGLTVPEATGQAALQGLSLTARFGADGQVADLVMPLRAAPGALEVLGAVVVELDGLRLALARSEGVGLLGPFQGGWRCEVGAGLWRRSRRWDGAASVRGHDGALSERVAGTLSSDTTLVLQEGPTRTIARWETSEVVRLARADGAPDGEARWTLSLEALDGAAAGVPATEGPPPDALFTVPAANLRIALAEAGPLLERAAGLTGSALLASVRGTGQAAEVPADPDLLWQGSGLLMLRPDLAEAFAALPDSTWTPAGLARLLSLLVSCGLPHCQNAALKVLSDPGHAARPQAGHHLQQLALLERPTVATGTFLLKAFEGATRGDVAWGAANALAIALRHHRDDPASAPWRAALRRVHDRSDAPEDRARALTLFGTSHDPSFAEPITAAMDDSHLRVRMAATRAATHLPGEGVDAHLLAASRDTTPEVRRRALEALADRRAPPTTWSAIADRWEARTDHDDLEVTWLLAVDAEAAPAGAEGARAPAPRLSLAQVRRMLTAARRSERLSDPVRARLEDWRDRQPAP